METSKLLLANGRRLVKDLAEAMTEFFPGEKIYIRATHLPGFNEELYELKVKLACEEDPRDLASFAFTPEGKASIRVDFKQIISLLPDLFQQGKYGLDPGMITIGRLWERPNPLTRIGLN
ncbi:MAG: hypothetical protein KJ718_05785 [Nanoarchaeota archaeon]|nr:hypothetical protein [Nanoarchaeota archaeon]MBU1052033.1 hypothetical protein [Nanoarchaeota archaeon]MBU1987880.1 hypothetical protein [Nanoarchaeota archaeon]